ncbi:hypothetical protein KP509_30G018500 [Ceratopteris richardii]|uniref:Thaumatin-like protein n=1 Tax=Ceratopteris richardii TaxID=49495 RepID=A0A8T2R1G9_CERRI|nr:hypothetical protein KP509_30G018500 [Ceratopteris richardii]
MSADLNLNCPKDLQMYSTSSIHLSDSNVIGCRSACDAFQSPQYCCTGTYANPNTCQATPYSEIFKQACPGAYSYAYDDHTSTFTCKGSDYSIIFCPSSLSQLKDLGNSQNASGSKEVSCCFLRSSLSILLLATLAAFTVY